jgi:hypothetical protein
VIHQSRLEFLEPRRVETELGAILSSTVHIRAIPDIACCKKSVIGIGHYI